MQEPPSTSARQFAIVSDSVHRVVATVQEVSSEFVSRSVITFYTFITGGIYIQSKDNKSY